MIETHRKTQPTRATAGETLVETLAALLVAAMAMSMLAMAIATSTSITRDGSQAMGAYAATNNAVVQEGESATTTTPKATIVWEINNDPNLRWTSTIDVTMREKAEDGITVRSYDYEEGSE